MLYPRPCHTDMTTTIVIAQKGSARKWGRLIPSQAWLAPLRAPCGCSSIFQTRIFATIGVTTGMKNSTRSAPRPRMRELSATASPSEQAMLMGT